MEYTKSYELYRDGKYVKSFFHKDNALFFAKKYNCTVKEIDITIGENV